LLLHSHHWFFFHKFCGLSHKTIGNYFFNLCFDTVKLA
jgi:hypothetical protein